MNYPENNPVAADSIPRQEHDTTRYGKRGYIFVL